MKRYIIEIEVTSPYDMADADWAEDLRLSSQEQLHRVVVRQRFADGQTSHPETVVGDERTCERCGAYTENGPGHWLEELGTEDRLCTDCFESRMLDKIADVLREPEWSPTTLDVVAMLVALTGRDLNTEES